MGIDLRPTTHQTDACMNGPLEGNVLLNDALNTLYSQLYGVGQLIKDHSDSESENLLWPLHKLRF